MKKLLLSALFTASFLTASAQYTDGILVLNEGGFSGNTASVSFIGNGAVQNNIFNTANGGAELGVIGQSMAFKDGKAYIVLNVSGKLVIANSTTFVEEASIEEGLENPRYTAFHGNNAYITCWGDAGDSDDDYVAVINLADNTITSTIALTEGVERIITIGDKLYVAHQGGYGQGNQVSVINAVTNTVETTITVGDVPNSMIEKDGFLYVLCAGNPSWAPTETAGKLVKIDLADNTVAQTIDFPAATHPNNLEVYGSDFYYTIDKDIFKKEIAETTLPEAPLFSINPQGAYGIYGFDIIDNKLYVADAVDYIAAGGVFIYELDGVFGQQYTVGVIPNSFYKAAAPVAGNDEFDILNVSVYPNPASDVLFVNTNEAAQVRLFDVTGRTVANANYSRSGINVSALPVGTYFAEITVEGARTVKQFIVQ